MRKWHALPVAALVAFAAGAMLFGSATPRATQAQAVSEFVLTIDCNVGNGSATGSIETDCTAPAGTTSYTVNVVLTNNTAAADDIAAFNFEVVASPITFFNPPVGADANLNSNPNFNEAGAGSAGTWACAPPPSDNDTGEEPGAAHSFLSCFVSDVGSPIAAGQSVVLASVTYVTTDGLATLDLEDAAVGDFIGIELISCNPLNVTGGTCPVTTVNIGASVAPTVTFTPTQTSTPLPTNTPCITGCPPTATPTTLRFVTVTPTPGPETPTAVVPGGGETPPPPPPPPPGGGGTSGTPTGGAGAGGGRPITLPDTGAGAQGGIDWTQASLLGLLALAIGGAAGGAYLAAATSRRGRDN